MCLSIVVVVLSRCGLDETSKRVPKYGDDCDVALQGELGTLRHLTTMDWFSIFRERQAGFQDLSGSRFLARPISESSLLLEALLLQLYPFDSFRSALEVSDTGIMASQTKRALYEPAPVHNKLQSNYEYTTSNSPGDNESLTR